jgi:hypothetical protein
VPRAHGPDVQGESLELELRGNGEPPVTDVTAAFGFRDLMRPRQRRRRINGSAVST